MSYIDWHYFIVIVFGYSIFGFEIFKLQNQNYIMYKRYTKLMVLLPYNEMKNTPIYGKNKFIDW